MRSPLKKLLVVVAPTFAAFAVAAGPASALPVTDAALCRNPNSVLLPAQPSNQRADRNDDGLVCVDTVGNERGVQDNGGNQLP